MAFYGRDVNLVWMKNSQYVSQHVERLYLTFISALESFPVHCLKFRPSGKRRRPGN